MFGDVKCYDKRKHDIFIPPSDIHYRIYSIALKSFKYVQKTGF